MLKPGEWGHYKIRILRKPSQELRLKEAKAQLRKCGIELRMHMARESRNQYHDVSVKMM